MALGVGIFGLVVFALGVLGVIAPGRLIERVRAVATPGGLWFVSGVRVLLGVVLLLAAEASRAPLYLNILGVVSLLAGVAGPFVGVRRAAALVDWWGGRPDSFVRLWSVFVQVFGLSMIWAVLP